MPITCCFSCFGFLGLVLLIPCVPISIGLLASNRKRAALRILCIPGGMIALSILLPLVLFILAERHNRIMSAQPDRLFEMTFAFWPPPQTEMLEGYYELGMDYEERALQFRAPSDVIHKIRGRRFVVSDRETFVTEGNHLPEQVQSWFLPSVAQADCFYIAEPFDDSFSTFNRAILCYNEKTGIACFHWVGLD